jgi:hypothetical protein
MNRCSMCNADLGTADTDGLCSACRNKPREKNQCDLTAGWLCPRCGTVHAPWVAQCQCRAPVVVTASSESGTSGGQDEVDRRCATCDNFALPSDAPQCLGCFGNWTHPKWKPQRQGTPT